jgi:hypothetical protein
MMWMSEHFWTVMGGGIVVILALVGVLLFLRNKESD